MRRALLAAAWLALSAFCPTPNPNLLGPPNFVDDCPVPAAGLNLAASLTDVTAAIAAATGASVPNLVAGGVTDNTTALQSFATGLSSGAIVQFPPGIFLIGGNITWPKGVTINGAGHPQANTYTAMLAGGLGGTIIKVSGSYLSGDVWTATGVNPFIVRNLMFDSDTQRTGGAYIVIAGDGTNPGRNPEVSGVMYHNGFDDYREDSGYSPRLDNNIHLDFASHGDFIKQNDTAADYGDGVFTRNLYWEVDNTAGTCDAGLYAEATGLFGVQSNKFNGCKHGVWVNLKHGPTGTAIVTGNSFENHTVDAMALTQGVTGKEYAAVNFSNNQFLNFSATTQGVFYVGTGTPTSAAKWIRQIVVAGNLVSMTHASSVPAININDGVGVSVIGNSCDGVTGFVWPCIAIAGGVTSVVHSLNNAYDGATSP